MVIKPHIKEVIVVEGRDDASNLKSVVDAEIIMTHGYRLSKGTLHKIKHAAQTLGVIVFTDPDHVGEQIRNRLIKEVPYPMKHAYISRQEGHKAGNIGVENASKEALLAALLSARAILSEPQATFSHEDMQAYGLEGHQASKQLRTALGQHLNIGYGNAKQFLKRLNNYGISRQEVEAFVFQGIEEKNE